MPGHHALDPGWLQLSVRKKLLQPCLKCALIHQFPVLQPRNPLPALFASWRAWRRHRAGLVGIARAGRLGPRLLADMGLTPDQIRLAQGGWDALRPNGFLVHRR